MSANLIAFLNEVEVHSDDGDAVDERSPTEAELLKSLDIQSTLNKKMIHKLKQTYPRVNSLELKPPQRIHQLASLILI